MSKTDVLEESRPISYETKLGSAVVPSVALFLLIMAFVWLALYRLSPPSAVAESASPSEFSSGRALKHLSSIARAPHPLGTAEHAAVRDYLVKELGALGLEAELQQAAVVNQMRGAPFFAGTVSNVLARLRGTGGGAAAVLLSAHYDSVPSGPGASDDGAAVAALLETARALKAAAPLKNDVIFLFTDGEEVGLLGAKAFADEHPWAKDVRVALNFEARGNSGAAVMFETSNGNGWLIKEFARNAPHPVASSLSYETYKRLPNDTDLSVFKAAGFAGLNFAYINGLTHYHTQLDSIGNIDERSLGHQGSYALALTRHFGALDLSNPKQGDAVYFDVLSLFVVHYPAALVLPLTLLTLLLFAGVLLLGFRRGRLNATQVALGFGAFLLSLVAAPLLVMAVWSVVRMLHPGYMRIPQGDTYNSGLYLVSFAALTVALTSAVLILFRRKSDLLNLLVGGLLWWAVLLVVCSLFMPGGSYLLTWPLLFMSAGLGWLFASKESEPPSAGRLVVLSLFAIPGILLFVPSIYLTLIAVPVAAASFVMILLVLLLVLLVPFFGLAATSRRWLLPGAALLLAVGFLLAGGLTAGFDRSRQEPSDLFYALNSDTGKSLWATSDVRPDEWTRQFLTTKAERGPLGDFFPLSRRTFLKDQAASAQLEAPQVALLDDQTNNDVRSLRFRITSPRQAPVVSIQMDSETEVLGSVVNGKRIDPRGGQRQQAAAAGGRNPWGLRYYGLPAEGIEVALDVRASQPVRLKVVDQTYGLPAELLAPFQARPENFMPAPFAFSPYGDSTLVGKSFAF
ncbi:MAG TPA: M28 family metallopeptidase [Pyrinomonadaceae bacterium]